MSASSIALSCGKMLGSGALTTAGGLILTVAIEYAIPKIWVKIKEYKNNSKEPVNEDDSYLC